MKVLLSSVLCAAALSAHGSPIVVSGWLTNVSGDDSPYEYAQFVATQNINFAATPFTIVWNDAGVAGTTGTASFSDGWAGGSLLSYAFQLASGTVTRGETFYIGGSAQLIAGSGSTSLAGERWLRTINTSTTGGDGLGTADSTGVFGNGGPHADGIAVFSGLAGAITSTSVPLDTVFFGNAVGTAKPATGGFKAAQNDHYTSSGVFGDAGNDIPLRRPRAGAVRAALGHIQLRHGELGDCAHGDSPLAHERLAAIRDCLEYFARPRAVGGGACARRRGLVLAATPPVVASVPVLQARLHESLEQRMRLVRFRLKFRVILAREEPRVLAQLDQLDERAVR